MHTHTNTHSVCVNCSATFNAHFVAAFFIAYTDIHTHRHIQIHTHTHTKHTHIYHAHTHTYHTRSHTPLLFSVFSGAFWPIAHFSTRLHSPPPSSFTPGVGVACGHAAGLTPDAWRRFYRCLRKFNKTLWQIINQLKIYNRLSVRPPPRGDNANTYAGVSVCVCVLWCSYNHTYSACASPPPSLAASPSLW